jgi:hypothetical protein
MVAAVAELGTDKQPKAVEAAAAVEAVLAAL